MQFKAQTSWTASFLTRTPETAIIYDTDLDTLTIGGMTGLSTLNIRSIPVEHIQNIEITQEWAGNTITVKSVEMGETSAHYLNRSSSQRLYNALTKRLETLGLATHRPFSQEKTT